MELRKADRRQTRIKMGLQGPSGSGKTYSALLIALGLCDSWEKIAVIDTENDSAHLYAHLGNFNVLSLRSPFTPEAYASAIRCCEENEMEVIIIDSSSHEWDGKGGILDIHGSMAGNSFTNWSKLTPRHNAFIEAILQSPCHVICTIRSKQDYVLVDKNGKMVPEKVGLKGIQRDGLEYDFTLLFELNIKNQAVATKDRTGLFFGGPEQVLTSEIGQRIRSWCSHPGSVTEITRRIEETQSIGELLQLYNQFPEYQQPLQADFNLRKRQLLLSREVHNQLAHQKTRQNGNDTSHE